MSLVCSLYVAILFFVLTPGILLRLPKNGGKFTVAAVHALVFGLVLYFTHRFVWRLSSSLEGFQEGASTTMPCNAANVGKTNGSGKTCRGTKQTNGTTSYAWAV